MANSDYYQVLGVSRKAGADELKKAYRKLSRENHPDAKPDDPAAAERFKQVQEAYSVLSDEKKRQQYDQFGTVFPEGGPGGGGAGPFPFQTGGQVPFDIHDLFGAEGLEGLFGGRAAGRRPRKGRDQQAEVRIPFLTAALGGSVDVRVSQGNRIETLSVKIPAGVTDGAVIRLGGQGESSPRGGSAGDLLLTVHIDPHPYFRREGQDILLDVPVTPAEAVLGAKIDVPTLKEGPVVLTVPPGTSSGMKLRLRGKGIADQGDQFVVVKIVAPRDPAAAVKELYQQLSRLDVNPRTGLW